MANHQSPQSFPFAFTHMNPAGLGGGVAVFSCALTNLHLLTHTALTFSRLALPYSVN